MVAENLPQVPPQDRELVLTRLLDAPRSLVFAAWTRPEHLARWLGPHGFTLPFCEVDFRPGGRYRFCLRSPDGVDHWVWGVYREIVEPELFVFTWEREDAAGNPRQLTVVTITLVEQEGQTKLTLHHALFPTVGERDDHRGGWSESLERLAAYVASAGSSSPDHRSK